jgi:hypothetical protein
MKCYKTNNWPEEAPKRAYAYTETPDGKEYCIAPEIKLVPFADIKVGGYYAFHSGFNHTPMYIHSPENDGSFNVVTFDANGGTHSRILKAHLNQHETFQDHSELFITLEDGRFGSICNWTGKLFFCAKPY